MNPEKHYEELRQTPDGPVLSWLKERMRDATIHVDTARLDEIPNWKMTDDGKYANLDKEESPKFFTVEGRMISTSGREVDAFGQPGIVEVPDTSDPDKAVGTVGLLVDRQTGDVLINAAAEPFQAAPGEKPGAFLSLRASIQGSYTNIQSGKVPFSKKVNLSTYSHFKSSNPGRMQGKIRFGYTIVDKTDIDLSEHKNTKWFRRDEIEEAIQKGAPFNALFDSAYSLYRSSLFGKKGSQGYLARTLKKPA